MRRTCIASRVSHLEGPTSPRLRECAWDLSVVLSDIEADLTASGDPVVVPPGLVVPEHHRHAPATRVVYEDQLERVRLEI